MKKVFSLLSLIGVMSLTVLRAQVSDWEWNGATSNDANDMSNWTESVSSNGTVDYSIPKGTPYAPVLTGSPLFNKNSSATTKLFVETGATFTIGEFSAPAAYQSFDFVELKGGALPNAGGQLVIDPKGKLSIGTSLVMTTNYFNKVAAISLKSDETGSGSVILPSNITSSGGNFVVEQCLLKGNSHYFAGWKYVSIPFETFNFSGSDFDYAVGKITEAYKWDEAGYMWKYISGSNALKVLKRGEGILARLQGSKQVVTLTSTSEFLAADFQVPLIKDDTGFELIGNPYVSGYRLNDQSANGLQSAVYEWNNVALNYNIVPVGEVLPALTGFFVKVVDPSGTFKFDANNRVLAASLVKSANVRPSTLALTIESDNGTYDKVYIQLRADASDAYEASADASKMFGNTAAPQAYFEVNGEKLSLNGINKDLVDNKEYPLCVKPGVDGMYTLNLDEFSIPSSYSVVLEDIKTGKIMPLDDLENYRFELKASDDPHRFNVRFKRGSTALVDMKNDDVMLYAKGKNIVVENVSSIDYKIELFDLSGQKVFTSMQKGRYNQIETNVQHGLYLVKLSGNGLNKVAKLLLK